MTYGRESGKITLEKAKRHPAEKTPPDGYSNAARLHGRRREQVGAEEALPVPGGDFRLWYLMWSRYVRCGGTAETAIKNRLVLSEREIKS